MYEIVGWKRLELNRVIRFNGVTDSNFNSILRRSFVWKPRARFVEDVLLSSDRPHFEAAAGAHVSSDHEFNNVHYMQ
jgi:hypothetical protein